MRNLSSQKLSVLVASFLLCMATGCAKGTGDLDDAGIGDDAATTGDAGAGADAAIVAPDAGGTAAGNPATGSVAGSVKASSANYKLVGTMNKGETNASSSTFKYQGGVLGATQPQ